MRLNHWLSLFAARLGLVRVTVRRRTAAPRGVRPRFDVVERLEERLLLAAPVATDDDFEIDADGTLSGDVIGGDNGHGVDSDEDLDPLLITQINGVTVTDGQQVVLASGALLTIHADGTFTYDPNGEFTNVAEGDDALDGFSYTISDGDGGIDVGFVRITVNGVNDAPDASNDEVFTNSDATGSGNLITADNGHGVDDDPDDGDILTLTEINGNAVTDGQVVTLPSGALLTIHEDGSYSYNPNGVFDALTHGQSAQDTFTYTIEDPHGVESTATVTVTIYGPNTPPTAIGNSNETDDNTPVGGNLITDDNGDGVDSDPEDDELTVTRINGAKVTDGQVVTLPSGALLTIHADGTYTYDSNGAFDELAAGEDDTDSFTYTVSDGNGGSSTATVTITIHGVNDGPAATDDDLETAFDGTVSGNLIDDDNGHGPDEDPEGDGFTLTQINGENITDDQVICLPSGARLTIHTDGTYTYDPNGIGNALLHGETVIDTFTYTVEDELGATTTATVTVTVHGPNEDPSATNHDLTVTEDTNWIGNLISNDDGYGADSDPEDDSLTLTYINGTRIVADEQLVFLPSGAAVVVFPNGTYLYYTNGAFESLAVGEQTTDSFTYTISDGNGGASTATVTVTITGANDSPDAGDDTNTVGEDDTVGGDLIANDSDPDASDALSITYINALAVTDGQVVTLSGGSQLTIHADGTYTYDPRDKFQHLGAGESAVEMFTYTVSDGHGGTATAAVRITVHGSNDAPTAKDDAVETDESDSVSGNLVTADNGDGPDGDIEDDALTVTQINGENVTSGQVITLPSGARLTIHANGNYTYDPNGAFDDLEEGETGADTFTYTVSDGNGGTDTAVVQITIHGYDDRADVKAVRQGRFVILSMKGVQLGADIDVVFNNGGVTLIGRHGTTINGLAMLQLNGVDSLKGALGGGDDQVHVTGEAHQFKLDLRQGDNSLTFEDFASAKLTTVVSKLGSLDFEALDSEFQKLVIQTGVFEDHIAFEGTTVLTTTMLKLLGGANEVSIDGSSFKGNFTLQSTGADALVEIEAGLANGSDSEFLGNVKLAVGGDATIDLSNFLLSDFTSFGKSVSIVAKQPNAVLTVSQAGFEKMPKLKNVTVIA